MPKVQIEALQMRIEAAHVGRRQENNATRLERSISEMEQIYDLLIGQVFNQVSREDTAQTLSSDALEIGENVLTQDVNPTLPDLTTARRITVYAQSTDSVLSQQLQEIAVPTGEIHNQPLTPQEKGKIETLDSTLILRRSVDIAQKRVVQTRIQHSPYPVSAR
jgi:hypothetical protein